MGIRWSRRVYPRACGGTHSLSTSLDPGRGLSPRVRGNPLPAPGQVWASGSIPARAGEPPMPESTRDRSSVYPRACGGTGGTFYGPTAGTGLSPRVRGNLETADVAHRLGGSIPARAGEPTSPRGSPSSGKVYPRACGGTGSADAGISAGSGLSPRVRGNHKEDYSHAHHLRSIPARAGEPPASWETMSVRKVYPRACGGT